jgi:hypothetical protein
MAGFDSSESQSLGVVICPKGTGIRTPVAVTFLEEQFIVYLSVK